MIVSIAVKLYMAYYNSVIGKKIDSSAMRATAADSRGDCLATTGVLVAAIVSRLTGLHIDGWCGMLVAILILISGGKAAKETIGPLLGQPPSPEMVEEIEKAVLANDGVIGIHDLVVHDYGPGRVMISLHAEVPASMDFLVAHDLIDNIEKDLGKQMGCEVVIHMDPIDTDDVRTAFEYDRIKHLVQAIDSRLSIHDFRLVTGPTHVNVIFDLVSPFDLPMSDSELKEKVAKEISALDSTYFAVIHIDKSYV